MRSSHRFWLALSLLLGAGAILIWLKERPEKQAGAPVAWSQSALRAAAPHMQPLLTTPSVLATSANPAKKPESAVALHKRYQLSNVERSPETWTRVQSAILMKNALIDTKEPVQLNIPADLRAGEHPGAYIVQADHATSDAFQKMLKDAGAQIVAYVPNNAFLVKAEANVAANLEQKEGVQSVLPYEPYYKLDTRLMKFAVDHETMADDAWLRVTLFPGASANSVQALANAVGPKEKSPFGEQILIQPQAGTLASIAQLPEVQIIEPVNPRIPANDLTRVTDGVSVDTTTNANHLGLSGKDVWVNLNDVGVDATHPALKGRVFFQGTNANVDFDGHGTHVAATLAGDHATQIFDNLGALTTNSLRTNLVVTTDESGNSVTNFYIDGSLTNADFRGIAHEAKLFVLPVDFTPDVNTPVTDTYLIETAARTNYYTLKRTNETLISNNSWNYANTPAYDSQAARFDAATRDALPDDTGSQPVTYVFAAGNLGFGSEDGMTAEGDTIASPGTAKNVITVGALEAPRFIGESLTNITVTVELDDQGQPQTNYTTNLVQVFRPITDSGDQVASFSSRGNVGIGVEGAQGRFKPDLVAPGVFIMSARSTNWNLTNDFSPYDPDTLPMFNLLSNIDAVSTKYRYDSGTSFSAPSVSGMLALLQEFFSHKLQPPKQRNLSPALMKAMLLNAARSVGAYDWDPAPLVNHEGWGLVDLRNLLTTTLEDTNQPAQSTLEAMDESKWPLILIDQSPTNAVATGEERVWNITVDTNAMGAPLRFTLVWTDPPGNPAVGVKLVNDLDLTVEANGQIFHGNDFASGSTETLSRGPLPAGTQPIDDPNRDNINNVEKIVIGDPQSLHTNVLTVKVSGRRVNVKAVTDYYNTTQRTNEIVQDYALVISADNSFLTNAFPKVDRLNPVTVKTNFVIQPIYNGLQATNQRAGANSPLYWTNGNAVQWRFYVFTNSDTALKAGYGVVLTAGVNVAFITSAPQNVGLPRNLEPDIDLYVSKDPSMTNLNPTAIANAWKSTTRLGTEQIVFAPDIYVRDSNGNITFTTNDDGTIITNTVTLYDPNHTDQGGVIVGQVKPPDEANPDVFYIGVKSEDQQAGEFNLIAISTQAPFEEDRNGVRVIHMLPAPAAIPDGTPNLPQGARYFGVPLRGGRILNASTYIAIQHEELGDLVGVVGHVATYATLNNHSLPNGFTNLLAIVYTDYPYAISPLQLSQEYPLGLYTPPFPPPGRPQIFRPDGPLKLASFTGQNAQPVWTLDMVDNTATHTGLVYQAEMHVTPLRRPLVPGDTIAGTVAPGGQDFYPLEVPNDATKVTLTLTLDAGPNTNVVLLASQNIIPSLTNADYSATFTNGNNTAVITFDRNSQPPLFPGEYIIGVVNQDTNNAYAYHLTVTIDSDSSGTFQDTIGQSNVPLTDDARTISEVDYPFDRLVAGVSVAVLSENARVSDLVLKLTSPQGTSVILSENRGFFDSNGFGSLVATTNFPGPSYAVFTDDLGSPIKFTLPPFGDSSTTRGFAFGNSFENAAEGAYLKGSVFDGWKVDSNSVFVVYGEAAQGQMYANLGTGGSVSQTLPTKVGRPYRLSFAYRGRPNPTRVFIPGNDDWTNLPAFGPVFSTGQIETSDRSGAHTNAPVGTVDRHYRIINNPDPNFPPPPGQNGSTLWIADTNAPPFPAWFANDASSQWITLMPQNDNGHTNGFYTNRTTFLLNEPDPTIVRVKTRLAGYMTVVAINVNGQNESGNPPFSYYDRYSSTFTLTGFTNGLNTIDYVVDNFVASGPTNSPEGFRAQSGMFLALQGATNSSQLVTNAQVEVGYMNLIGAASNAVFSVTGAPEWQRFETEFIADKTNMVVQFFAGTNFPGVDIDDVQLEDTGTVYLNPEEPLSVLQGERAMGQWKLDVIDNRTGATNPAFIDDWKLMLDVATPARYAEPLASGLVYPTVIHNPIIRAETNIYTPGRLLGGETEWFYFDVCSNATFATVRLFAPSTNSIPIELLVDRSGFPTGDPAKDDYAIIRTTPGANSTVTLPLTLTSPAAAPLQPGKRLFIAVRAGEFPSDTNQTFRINIQPDGCTFTAPTVLTPSQALSTVAFAPSPGDDGTTYQITTAGASSVTLTAAGDLTILASNGVEPTESDYQLKQTVSSGTGTLALPSAGTWFFRVINNTTDTVPYTMTVTEQTSAIRDVSVVDNHLNVTFATVVGTSYEIATSTDLVNWTPVATIQATSTQTTYTDTATATDTARFIRIRPL